MSVFIVMESFDYEGGWLNDEVQSYATREEAIGAEVPKAYRNSLYATGRSWEVIEVKLP